MNNKKKILICVDWFVPGYKAGGPIQSCANIIAHLNTDFDFYVVTRNTDFGDPKPYSTVVHNQWIKTELYHVYYVSEEKINARFWRKILHEKYDIVYFNSLFSFKFTIQPLWILRKQTAKKIILAPRGMLGAGALQLKSTKKKLFISAVKLLNLFKNILWQASTEMERTEITTYFPAADVKIAVNLPPKKNISFHAREKKNNELRLFFLSRISPKKNLLSALTYLQKVNPNCKIQFDIIGPVEDAIYWETCQKQMDVLKQKNNIEINVLGAIPNDALNATLRHYHFMLLPTFNENFGHVIVEAFAAGCPVIISDQTPWRNLEQKKLGFDIPLNAPEQFVAAIEKAAVLNQLEFDKLSNNAFNAALHIYADTAAVEQNRALFTNPK